MAVSRKMEKYQEKIDALLDPRFLVLFNEGNLDILEKYFKILTPESARGVFWRCFLS